MIASYAFYSDYSAGFYDICRSMEGIFSVSSLPPVRSLKIK